MLMMIRGIYQRQMQNVQKKMRVAHGELPFWPERKNEISKHDNKKNIMILNVKNMRIWQENVLLMRIKSI